jgi:translation initiation factor 1
MGKKDYAPPSDSASDNPFAALSRLNDLPPPPDDLPQEQEEGVGAPIAIGAGASFSDNLRVLLDRKQRRGKTATIVTGLTGEEDALHDLGKALKVHCGVGGSVKNGEIILQGDQRERVVAFLRERGYRNTKKAGG